MSEEIIAFHNLHLPNEVRVFQIPRENIRVWDDNYMVYDVKMKDSLGNDFIFRHYSFYDKWFEVNITLDESGKLITERGPIDWSYNCDICTPCFSTGTELYNLDLELDILVNQDGQNYIVIDEDDFENVVNQGLLSDDERIGARKGLESLIELIESGNLQPYLESVCSFTDLIRLSDTIPHQILQLSDVPLIDATKRRRLYGKRTQL
ncbi:YgaC family protein [Paenibacillus lupini]|uniref:YgaC family protein n=1 Tax=Paenibacillus lupini TaxID=1450204 RepID=UPI00141E4D6A|nr:YgaC family protein [Paenibacillus lupini]NIK21860.1 putative RNA-binding protein associated with RNAse of E/G family [Paenibacillus lupini]